MDVEHLWFSTSRSNEKDLDIPAVNHDHGGENMVQTLTNMADKRLFKLVKWCKSLPLFKNILVKHLPFKGKAVTPTLSSFRLTTKFPFSSMHGVSCWYFPAVTAPLRLPESFACPTKRNLPWRRHVHLESTNGLKRCSTFPINCEDYGLTPMNMSA